MFVVVVIVVVVVVVVSIISKYLGFFVFVFTSAAQCTVIDLSQDMVDLVSTGQSRLYLPEPRFQIE